jgi:uncharacterized membrane-anchored protein
MNKIPAINMYFWMIELCAAALANTDVALISQKFHLGSTEILLVFAALFVVAAGVQLATKKLHLFLFWLALLAANLAGAVLPESLYGALQLDYMKGSAGLAAATAGIFLVWLGIGDNPSLQNIQSRRTEALFWCAALFASAFGSALGHWLQPDSGLKDIIRSAIPIVPVLLCAMVARFTKLPRPVLFWGALIATQPLGRVLGSFLILGHDEHGMGFGAMTASALLAYLMFALVVIVMRRQKQPSAETPST